MVSSSNDPSASFFNSIETVQEFGITKLFDGDKERLSKDRVQLKTFPGNFLQIPGNGIRAENRCFGFVFDQFSRNFHKFYLDLLPTRRNESSTPPPPPQSDQWRVLTGISKDQKVNVNGISVSSSKFPVTSPVNKVAGDGEESAGAPPNNVVDAAPSPSEKPGDSVLISALAGGIACAISTTLMHPVDTIKTQVQASSTLSLPEIISRIPQIGLRGLYRGSIPAILGQFSSHGLRTGICEASKLILINLAPTLPAIQVESLASFCGTYLGTASRIPSEVLKQQLQAGNYENVAEALVGTWQQDGLKGFFRGTFPTLCREVPFYVFGTGLYTECVKVAEKILRRELEPWERMGVGAITGGLTAMATTPLDVVKTRMMIDSQSASGSILSVAVSIFQDEGPLGLYKGAIPRFFWVAPLGAINFAGYELIKNLMEKTRHLSHTKMATSS